MHHTMNVKFLPINRKQNLYNILREGRNHHLHIKEFIDRNSEACDKSNLIKIISEMLMVSYQNLLRQHWGYNCNQIKP